MKTIVICITLVFLALLGYRALIDARPIISECKMAHIEYKQGNEHWIIIDGFESAVNQKFLDEILRKLK